VKPGNANDPCLAGWPAQEGHGLVAVDAMLAAYTAAGAAMRDSIELAMVTRTVETGPYPDTFAIRDGALAYAPFDTTKTPDGVVYDGSGAVISPIDEFNAPVGAGLCQEAEPMFPAAAIPGTEGILPYGSCLELDLAGDILGDIFDIDFHVDATHPICETTRTTISALRLGDYIIGTMPGELTVMLATYLRSKSPTDEAHTILVGYAQGHVGYMLRPEDWLLGGYEPSITFWGPLEAEYIGEQLVQLLPVVQMPTRQDGTTETTQLVSQLNPDSLAVDDPAPLAGSIPGTIPAETWGRTGHPTKAQPDAQIPRVSGIATFVWIGDDPQVKTPHVRLEVESPAGSGTFVAAKRRSGREVNDSELVLSYTPSPLQRSGPQSHVWTAELQAVPWLGLAGLDDLASRAGMPLGKYRFHVDGSTWSLDSDAFQVIPGGLEANAATHAGGKISVIADLHAPKGYRVLDLAGNSNVARPVAGQSFKVELLNGTGSVLATTNGVMSSATGELQVDTNASATQVRITDRFGNAATATIN